MKRLISVSLCLIMTFTLLTGCNSGPTATTATTAKTDTVAVTTANSVGETTAATSTGKKMLIGISMANTDEYRTSWLDVFKRLAGDKYTIEITNCNKDNDKQIGDIDSLIARKPDLLIVQPSSDDAVVPALESAASKGIPVILVDSIPKTEMYTAVVTDDQRDPGKLQADFVNAWLDADSTRVANVGYIQGALIYEPTKPREPGFFDNCPRAVKIVEGDAEFNVDKAMAQTEDWLQKYPQINVYVAMNDDMAIGCIQALKAAGKNLDDIIVVGVDGTKAGIEALKAGEMDMTAKQDVEIAAKACFDTMTKILSGEKVDKLVLPHSFKALLPKDVQ